MIWWPYVVGLMWIAFLFGWGASRRIQFADRAVGAEPYVFTVPEGQRR